MQTQQIIPEPVQQPHAVETFAIELSQDLRKQAEAICASEDITLEEFVRGAIADRIAHQSHVDWVKSRRPSTQAGREAALKILRRPSSTPPDPGDYKAPVAFTAQKCAGVVLLSSDFVK
jgi:hypothetical protein